MESVGGNVQLMHMGRYAQDRVGQARSCINTDVAAHTKKSLVPIGYRVLFRIPLLAVVGGGAGGRNDRGIKNRVPSLNITPFSLSI